MKWFLVLALVSSCKSKDAAVPATGSGSAVAMVPADAGAVPEQEDIEAGQAPQLAAAFGKKMPRLPAISADGSLIATLDEVTGGPAMPAALQVTIAKFPTRKVVEDLPILTFDEAMHANEAGGDNWLTPALAKQLDARGKAIARKLAGFHSLKAIDLVPGEGFEKKPTKIGELTLNADSQDDALVVTLTDAHGKVIHRDRTDATSDHSDATPCAFTPFLAAAFTDPAKPRALYLEVRFRYRDGCSAVVPDFVVWSTDPSSTTPAEQIESIVETQLDVVGMNNTEVPFAPGAMFVGSNVVTEDLKLIGVADKAMDYSGSKLGEVDVTRSRDGKTAWASATGQVSLLATNKPGEDATWRVGDVLVDTAKGWRIAVAAWTQPVDNAKANRDAKAGTLKAQKLDGDPGDASLNAAFAKLVTDGATNVAKDIVAIGSGPGERTVGAFAKPWNAAWKGKTTIVSSIARLAPSGTTGWVVATIELQKTGYKIPFTVFAVFDKDPGGAWTLVHIQLAI